MTSVGSPPDRYREVYESFRWDVPARFNLAHACCGRWAGERHRLALYWEDESGERRALSYWDLEQAANATAKSALNRWLVKWTFKHMLVKRAYTPAAFRQMAAQSRFGTCNIETDAIGMTVRLSK